MRFLKLTLAYDGTNYVGWQVQPNGISVQESLERAWQTITGESIRITASGRTDAGVHALGQVCSLCTHSTMEAPVMLRALNANLAQDITVLNVVDAARNFHAIRDARKKTYRYRIQHGGIPDVFQRNYCWFVPQRLDGSAMRSAAAHLVGRHDFVSFQAAGSERGTTVRTIESLVLSETPHERFHFIEIEITADGFLYNMVRNIVGTLVQVGQGKHPPQWLPSVLAAKDRSAAGITAPARGLFLVRVDYDCDQTRSGRPTA